jgi:hypothetical protein
MDKFMPRPETKFAGFVRAFIDATEALSEVLGIPTDAVEKAKTQRIAYDAAFTACEQPNAGRVDREKRNERRKELEHTIRAIKNAYIDSDPKGVVTDEIRLQFQLPPRDAVHTPVGTPIEVPPFTLATGGYLQIIVRHPAKPPRYTGAVLFYKVSEKPIVTIKELTSSKLLTRIKEIIAFEESDKLKTLYAALRWQNEKGELGPPSPIRSLGIV